MGRLHDAALMGKLEEVKRLVREEGRDINERNAQGETPLARAACGTKGTPVLEWLLQQEDVDIDAVNKDGYSALHFCYANAHHVALLLQAGADPTLRERRHPHTLFLHAVYNGYNDVVRVLMADPRVRAQVRSTIGGQGPLSLCMARLTTDPDLERLALLLDPNLSPINPMIEGPLLLRDCRAWLAAAAARKHKPSTITDPVKAAMGAELQRTREALTHRAVALLEGAMAQRDLAYHLARARVVVDAAAAAKAGSVAAVPACLRGRVVGSEKPLPVLGLAEQGMPERYRAVLSYALHHLPTELFEELCGMLKGRAWSDPDYCCGYSALVRDVREQQRKRARAAASGSGAEVKAAEGF